CDPCWGTGHAVGSAGFCEESSHHANYWVCIHPSKRADGDFHGERCDCDSCGRLFCRPHARRHARTHRSTTTGGFPNFGFNTAAPVFGAAALAPTKVTEDSKLHRQVTDFLFQIRPGAEEMARVTRLAGKWIFDPSDDSVSGEFTLPISFLTPSRIS